MAYLQVTPLGGSRDETWRGQGIRKSSVSWNLPKLSRALESRNEVSSVNTLHERYLCSTLRTSEHSFLLLYRVYSVNTDTILMLISEVSFDSKWD
jgi:hypothetical protein